MIHLVLFSGGISSALTALWVKNNMNIGDELHLLFTDTRIEDIDLYRFIIDCYDYLNPDKFIWLTDGRTPWEVFWDEKFIGNSRVDICSRVLKREISRKYIENHYTPINTVIYLGLHWSESDRLEKALPHWKPWTLKSILCGDWWLEGQALKSTWLELTGIKIPRLYGLGFPHNNCGGFCTKAGLRHFKHLLKALPDVYQHHEEMEQLLRELIGKDVAILRLQRKNESRPITLRELRLRIETGVETGEGYEDWGGCTCMLS